MAYANRVPYQAHSNLEHVSVLPQIMFIIPQMIVATANQTWYNSKVGCALPVQPYPITRMAHVIV